MWIGSIHGAYWKVIEIICNTIDIDSDSDDEEMLITEKNGVLIFSNLNNDGN